MFELAWLNRRGALAMIFVLFACFSGKALSNGSEGEEWLQWNQEMRALYIRAYATGLQNGYGIGCHLGMSAAVTQLTVNAESRAIKACWEKYPFGTGTAARDPVEYISVISDFYRTFPDQRYLEIRNVLLQVSKGHSIKEIHEHFLKSNIP